MIIMKNVSNDRNPRVYYIILSNGKITKILSIWVPSCVMGVGTYSFQAKSDQSDHYIY